MQIYNKAAVCERRELLFLPSVGENLPIKLPTYTARFIATVSSGAVDLSIYKKWTAPAISTHDLKSQKEALDALVATGKMPKPATLSSRSSKKTVMPAGSSSSSSSATAPARRLVSPPLS